MKEAVTTIRLNEADARFVSQQVSIVNALADDPYRRQYTAADLFRMLTLSARKAYEAFIAGMLRENVPPFVEWWQAEFPRFSAFLANRENQENREFQHKIAPVVNSPSRLGDATPSAERSIALGGRPLRFSAINHRLDGAMAPGITPFRYFFATRLAQ